MKVDQLIILLLIFAGYCCNLEAQKINGLSFVASDNAIGDKEVEPVIRVHANYVSLMPFGFMKSLSEPEIAFNKPRQWFGERVEGVRQYAKTLRKKNIRIMLKPQIWVWRGEFTGRITMQTEERWKVLEQSYASFILLYAKVAQEIGADIFCIGTELENFVMHRPEYWKSLIISIRKVYQGALTYAANWDEFKRVPFWGALDYIGVDAYFPLSQRKSPTVEVLEAGWKVHKQEIMTVQSSYLKPILFTEFGYRSMDYTGKSPWDSRRIEGSVNLDAQSNGLNAIYRQFWKEDWFAGGFVWKWFVDYEQAGGLKNNRFTPQNKPAEQVLKQLFGTKK